MLDVLLEIYFEYYKGHRDELDYYQRRRLNQARLLEIHLMWCHRCHLEVLKHLNIHSMLVMEQKLLNLDGMCRRLVEMYWLLDVLMDLLCCLVRILELNKNLNVIRKVNKIRNWKFYDPLYHLIEVF